MPRHLRSVDRVTVEPRWAELLRRLALNDEHAVGSLMSPTAGESQVPELRDREGALLRIAALIATDSAASSFQWAVSSALASGAEDDEIIGVLCAIAPIVGSARVALAAPSIASALGYDLDALGDI
jgi:4-carboxymuconolactone decarboxylase